MSRKVELFWPWIRRKIDLRNYFVCLRGGNYWHWNVLHEPKLQKLVGGWKRTLLKTYAGSRTIEVTISITRWWSSFSFSIGSSRFWGGTESGYVELLSCIHCENLLHLLVEFRSRFRAMTVDLIQNTVAISRKIEISAVIQYWWRPGWNVREKWKTLEMESIFRDYWFFFFFRWKYFWKHLSNLNWLEKKWKDIVFYFIFFFEDDVIGEEIKRINPVITIDVKETGLNRFRAKFDNGSGTSVNRRGKRHRKFKSYVSSFLLSFSATVDYSWNVNRDIKKILSVVKYKDRFFWR